MFRADVALISPYPDSGQQSVTSGVATYARNLAHALAGAGASVTVVAPRDGQRREAQTDGPVRVVRSIPTGPGALLAARRAASATGAPVIHLQHELFLYGGASAVPGLLAALSRTKNSRQAVVVTMHQVVDPATISASFVRLHRVRVPAVAARMGIAALQHAIQWLSDGVIVHEEAFLRALPRATAVPHGLEVVRRPDTAKARAELGLDDEFTVLCFGFLAPYKGLELACEAVDLARQDEGGIRLVVAGGEHPRLAGRDSYAAALRARFGGSTWFPGYVPEADVPLWFAAADVALFPYPQPHAASGAVALALAYGTPFLLSKGLADLTGAPTELVASSNAAELAGQLRRLAGSATALRSLAARCAGLAAGRSWPAVAHRHLKIYEEVLHANRAPGRGFRARQSR
jgi:glycosyltransferase involved in cell wall biosynthesis